MVETCEFPPLSTCKDSVCFTDLVRILVVFRLGCNASIKRRTLERILDKYGVLCIDENDDELLELFCTEEGKRQRTTSKGENAFFYGDWDFYSKNFQSIPCASLFFDDHYIKNDAWYF